jgi:hypothetical protein
LLRAGSSRNCNPENPETNVTTFVTTRDREFGPVYNIAGAGLDKHRRRARTAGGLKKMDKAFRREYGEAVEKAVLAAQRSALLREGSPLPSGVGYGDALLARLNARLLAAPSAERRARTPNQWREMYAAAMEEKEKAAEAAKLAKIDARIRKQVDAMKPKKRKTRA